MSDSSDGGERLSRTAFELERIWKERPRICGICEFVTTGVIQYVDGLFYENVNDPQTRDAIRAAGGFCRYHAQFIARQADALGTAIILRDVLTTAIRALNRGEYDALPSGPGPLARLLDQDQGDAWDEEVKNRPCTICDHERDITARAVDSLLQALDNQQFAETFGASDGLCLAHFRLAHDRANRPDAWKQILETEKQALERLIDQLAELARKHDYRFKDEPRGEEMRSWIEGLNIVTSWVRKV